jgi:hypothetical protein
VPILYRSTAIIAIITIITIITLVYPTPDGILCLVGEVSGAVVARLVTTVARADIVALLLAPITDVRQNDLVHVAVWAPAVSSRWDIARVVALREALMAIVGPENSGPHITAVGAATPVFTAGIARRAELGCLIGTVGLLAEVDVRVREGHLVVIRLCDESGDINYYAGD